MLQQLRQASDGLHRAGRDGHLTGVLIPAMYGCPDCKTAWVIIAPIEPGSCADCGAAMVVLTEDQVAVVMDKRPA